MSGRELLIAAAALAVLSGCRGCGEHSPPPSVPPPPTATAAGAALGASTATPLDHVVISWAEAEPDSGPAPLTVRFRMDDPFHNIEDPQLLWDFGDGSPTSDKLKPTHVYERPGKYEVHLKVTDATGMTDEDTIEIEVTEPDATPSANAATPQQ